MAIPEDRLSTSIVDGVYIPPEAEDRASFLHDIEGGPKGLTDTSGGMNYQNWDLSLVGDMITLTPRTEGSAISVVLAPGATQASFCFDQNARPSAVWITPTACNLYWYDSAEGAYVTTDFGNTIVSAMLSLDDKRELEVGANDIIFWYTKETSSGIWTLFHRKQRERFLTEYTMTPPLGTVIPPRLWKAGMHKGLRGKVTLTYRSA